MINDKQMEELRKIKELYDSGILTQEEFEQKKQIILDDTEKSNVEEVHEVNSESDGFVKIKSNSIEDSQSVPSGLIGNLSSTEESTKDNSNKTQEEIKTPKKKKSQKVKRWKKKNTIYY